MNPAYSVIFFTTASGAGYGLMIWAAVMSLIPGKDDCIYLMGQPAAPRESLITASIIGIMLAAAGLASSFGHLGRPERAWRAYSQWRTSWLSREGVAATVTFGPALWLIVAHFQRADTAIAAMALIICAVVTVHCTAMIYASLKTIPRWHQSLVPWVYLTMAIGSGSVVGAVSLTVSGAGAPVVTVAAAVALAVAWVVKLASWRQADRGAELPTRANALGLPEYQLVTLFEGPGMTRNFVQREMGYRIGRKHAAKLRRIALAAAAASVSLLLASTSLAGWQAMLAGAGVMATLGVSLVIERWLFFAEAEHVVGRYY